MVTQQARRAVSNYRQVRLTFTQEVSGRCSYSIMAKALNAQWDQGTVLIRDSVTVPGPLESTEHVLRALLVILEEQFLPSGHTD